LWGCFGSARTGTGLPRRAAQGFADHLNGVLNATVSDSRLSLIPVPGDPAAFELTRIVGRDSAPLELYGTTVRLFVRQVIVVKDGHCSTESYGYRLQTGESTSSWLIRWEYLRQQPKPDYPYPLAHVHVNGQRVSGARAALPKLHIPTSRLPLELVLWHVIVEWGVKPKRADWQQILEGSIRDFEARRSTP
jgi:hypothetical protein